MSMQTVNPENAELIIDPARSVDLMVRVIIIRL